MADIKQAAKWMQEGKKVRRCAWMKQNPELALNAVPAGLLWDIPESGYGEGLDCVVNANVLFSICFSTTALLADDWEIAN